MNKITSLLLIAIFFLSCQKNIKLVSEITPIIEEQTLVNLENKKITKNIVKYNSEILLFDLTGKILKFNPSLSIFDFLYNIDIKIDNYLFRQNNHLILREKNSQNYVIIDLKKLRIKKILKNFELTKILGIDDNHLIYQKQKELFFYHYPDSLILRKLSLKDKNIFNCEFGENLIYILGKKNIYIYHLRKKDVEIIKIDNQPSSKFLLDRNHIYYGSRKNELIKYSLKKRKVTWKLIIPNILKLKPQLINKYIFISPEDNNIYFVKKNGTLNWWGKYNSTRLMPPIVMRNNVSIFLMNNEVKFFNPKKREEILFKLKSSLKSNPIVIGNFIYVISQKNDSDIPAIRMIGNKYGIILETDPKFLKPKGKSIKFDIKSINLIKPKYQIEIIFDSKKIFEKEITQKELAYFIWIPQHVGHHTLNIEIKAENQKNMRFSKKLEVVDLEKVLKNHFHRLQTECSNDILKAKNLTNKNEANH